MLCWTRSAEVGQPWLPQRRPADTTSVSTSMRTMSESPKSDLHPTCLSHFQIAPQRTTRYWLRTEPPPARAGRVRSWYRAASRRQEPDANESRGNCASTEGHFPLFCSTTRRGTTRWSDWWRRCSTCTSACTRPSRRRTRKPSTAKSPSPTRLPDAAEAVSRRPPPAVDTAPAAPGMTAMETGAWGDAIRFPPRVWRSSSPRSAFSAGRSSPLAAGCILGLTGSLALCDRCGWPGVGSGRRACSCQSLRLWLRGPGYCPPVPRRLRSVPSALRSSF